jgi:hypothetical protein
MAAFERVVGSVLAASDQPFNTFPQYRRRLSLARLPLVNDGFARHPNLFRQARLGEPEFASDAQ